MLFLRTAFMDFSQDSSMQVIIPIFGKIRLNV